MNRTEARVDADFIAAHRDDPSVRFVEVDVSPAVYEAGHIPGAVLWNAYADLRHPDYRTIAREELRALVERSGIGPDTTVITYGYGAHLGYWLLRSVGHDRVKLMDGPRDQWTEAGYGWSADVPVPATTAYELPAQDRYIASMEDVLAMAEQPSAIVLDVRSEAEYAGVQFWPSGASEATGRSGHVPGAVQLGVDTLHTSQGTLKSVDELGQLLQERGITPASEIITYCTIGNRASQAWFALSALLGFGNVRVYYGSWVEWGMDPHSPIEP